MSLRFYISSFVFILVFLFTPSILFFINAREVFLIDPSTSPVDADKIIIPTWQENKDYTATDPDGGILIFDGALAESTILRIRNIKAKRIEVNATMSRGCTLMIENCTLVGEVSSPGDFTGGIVVAPTTFTSRDGKIACSNAARTLPSSPNNKIFITIRNNNIMNSANKIVQYVSESNISDYNTFSFGIGIYNLITCNRNNNNNQNDFVMAEITLDNNTVNITNSDDQVKLYAAMIYPTHRVIGDTLKSCYNNVDPLLCPFEIIVPISLLNITNNHFVVRSSAVGPDFASAVGLGFLETVFAQQWPAVNFQFLNDRTLDGCKFNFEENDFEIQGSWYANAVWLATFGKTSTPATNPSAQPPFVFDFHHQKQISLSNPVKPGDAALYIICLSSLWSLVQFKISINYYSNYRNVNLAPGFDLFAIQLAASRENTNLVVKDSTFGVIFSNNVDFNRIMIQLQGEAMGNITVQNVSAYVQNKIRFEPRTFFVFLLRSPGADVTPILQNVFFKNVSFTYDGETEMKFYLVSVQHTVVRGELSVDASFVRILRKPTLLAVEVSTLLDVSNCTVMNRVAVTNSQGTTVSGDVGLLSLAQNSTIREINVSNNIVHECKTANAVRGYVEEFTYGLQKLVIRNNFHRANSAADHFAMVNAIFDPVQSSEYIVEGNVVYHLNGAGDWAFLWGFSAATATSPVEKRVLVVKNNKFIVAGRQPGKTVNSLFLIQRSFAAFPKEYWFAMSKIILDGNEVRMSEGANCGFHQILIAKSRDDVTIDETNWFFGPLTVVMRNNYVNMSVSGTALPVVVANAFNVQNILFNNNTFAVKLVPPLGLVAELAFASFSYSTLHSVNLSESVSSSAVGYPTASCSTYDGTVVDAAFFRDILGGQIKNWFAQLYMGTGKPKSFGTLNPGICSHTTHTATQNRILPLPPSSQPPRHHSTTTHSQMISATRSFVEGSRKKRGIKFFASSLVAVWGSATFALSALAVSTSATAVSVRTKTVLAGVDEIMSGDCGSVFSADFLDDPPEIADSPTQMYLAGRGNGGYATGLIVGDFIMILVLVGFWFLCFVLLENYGLPWLVKMKNKNVKLPQKKPRRILTLQFLAKSRMMIPAFNFGLLFLDPMFNAAIAIIFIGDVSVGWKIVGVLISIVLLMIFFFLFVVIYKLLISRNAVEHFHKFQPCELKKANDNALLTLWYFLMQPEGEWWCRKVGSMLPSNSNNNNNKTKGGIYKNSKNLGIKVGKVSKRDVILWKFTEPVIEGSTNRFPKFAVVDVVTIIALTLSLVIGHSTANCVAMGVLLLLSAATHMFIVIFYRPDQELLMRILNGSADAIQVALIICALAGAPVGLVLTLAVPLVVVQTALVLLMVISILLTIIEFLGNEEKNDTKKESGSIKVARGDERSGSRHHPSSSARHHFDYNDDRHYDDHHHHHRQKHNVSSRSNSRDPARSSSSSSSLSSPSDYRPRNSHHDEGRRDSSSRHQNDVSRRSNVASSTFTRSRYEQEKSLRSARTSSDVTNHAHFRSDREKSSNEKEFQSRYQRR